MTVILLVDTGASRTMIDQSIADALSLDLVGQRPLHTVANIVNTNVYVGDSGFPNTAWSHAGMQLPIIPKRPIHAFGVLGRDILNQGKLEYDGINHEFVLTL
jgi:predicted aspartyl protease